MFQIKVALISDTTCYDKIGPSRQLYWRQHNKRLSIQRSDLLLVPITLQVLVSHHTEQTNEITGNAVYIQLDFAH